MTEMNNPGEPPKGWVDLLKRVHAYGVASYRWTEGEVRADDFRRLLKTLTFHQNYSKAGATPEGKWALSLTMSSLGRAVSMALGQQQIDYWLFEHTEPFSGTLSELAERLNEGITRDNVHTIESRSRALEVARKFAEAGSNPEEPEFCDGSCQPGCQYGGHCGPGECPGPCGG